MRFLIPRIEKQSLEVGLRKKDEPGGAGWIAVLERAVFGCAGQPDAPTPQPMNPDPGPGNRPRSRHVEVLDAGNGAQTQIPTFTKHGHMTYQNATFYMLMAVMPATRPNSEPDITILL